MLAPILREWPLVWLKNKKWYTSKAKTYINYDFFFLSFALLPILLLGVLLFFFIIYFYLIDITYKYNKLLLIWQKCMITYIIIFIYAFNGCCLTDLSIINNFFRLLYNIVVLYTKLYLEY